MLPWYAFARAHGPAALRAPFTNYPPYYSYLLLLITQLDQVAAPLSLIKGFSAAFELGCGVTAASIVRAAGGGRWASSVAFAGVWLAPTVLLNGPYWGQADSIWTFFTLLSIRLFMASRNGIPSFAAAFAVKAQSVFLGPFILGMIFKRRGLWPWVAAVPVVYIFVALPVLLAGRPLADVLSIYLDQAGTYAALSSNAANPWIVIPLGETIGVIVGLALAAGVGLYLAVVTARISMEDREGLVVAACASLLAMPFLLPKMHDRYFYAFEIAAIALACRNPRFIGVAVMAQANGVLSYMMFERHFPPLTLAPAAFCNGAMAALLIAELARPAPGRRWPIAHLAVFAAAAVALVVDLLMERPGPAAVGWYPLFAGVYGLTGALLVLRTRREGSGAPDRRGWRRGSKSTA